MTNIIFKYVSDIHLESNKFDTLDISDLWNFDPLENHEYYLALAGDIGNPLDSDLDLFLQRVSPKYSKIFYVMGNHEYHNLNNTEYSMNQIVAKMEIICKQYQNVILLDNTSYNLRTVKIIGTTLWSNIPDHAQTLISGSTKDLTAIFYCDKIFQKKLLTIKKYNSLNNKAIQFIKKEISLTDKPIIVLTHHAPLFNNNELGQYTADPTHPHRGKSYAFHNDLNELIRYPIVLWIFGHTHYASKFCHNGVIIATNQMGYSSERNRINFNPKASIKINDLI